MTKPNWYPAGAPIDRLGGTSTRAEPIQADHAGRFAVAAVAARVPFALTYIGHATSGNWVMVHGPKVHVDTIDRLIEETKCS